MSSFVCTCHQESRNLIGQHDWFTVVSSDGKSWSAYAIPEPASPAELRKAADAGASIVRCEPHELSDWLAVDFSRPHSPAEIIRQTKILEYFRAGERVPAELRTPA